VRVKHSLTTVSALAVLATLVMLLGSIPNQASHVAPLVHEKNMSRSDMGHVFTHEKETSVAVDPNDPNRMMAAANTLSGGRNFHEWYASSDGGRSFKHGQIPIDTNLTVDCGGDPDDCVPNSQVEYSDPWLAYGNDGTVYHSAIAHGDDEHGSSLVVQTSTDQGEHWSDASAGIVAEGLTTPFVFADKESMAVDRVHGDNVYVVWNPRQDMLDSNGNTGKQIVFSRDLGGRANGLFFSTPVVISNFATNFDTDLDPPHQACRNHGPNVIVDASGTIWVAWTRLCDGDDNGDPGAVWVAKSTDQGQSFEAPVKAANLFHVGGISDPVPGITGSFRGSSDPTIASDPLTGRLFVAYATNAGTTSDPDVELVTSSDGVNWSSAPIRVNQDTGTTTQLQPSVAVQDGWLVVNFYTTADGADVVDDHLAYAPVSASPSFTEIRLSSVSTPQPTGFLGDYTAVAFGSDGVAHAVWTDQREGDDADAYSARIDFSPPAAIAISAGSARPFGEIASFTATVTGAHGEAEQFIPLDFTVTTSGLASPESASGQTGVSGQMSFSYSNAHAGTDTLHVWVDLNENDNEDTGETRDLSVIWLKHPTTTTYSGPTLIANALEAQLTARLTDDGSPINAKLISFTVGGGGGAQACSDVTDLNGVASCNLAVNQPLGPGIVSAVFAGDSDYEPSSSITSTIVFAYTAGGNFVIGDLDASGAGPVTFWSSTWANANHLSGGPTPSQFKGFATSPSGPTSCGGTWSAIGGTSSSPPASVPSYAAMLVTNSINVSGTTITGSKPKVVIVRTNLGYQPAAGHPGTGEIVAVLCP
jgi:hypothetical protein